jgi:hypothetical protein
LQIPSGDDADQQAGDPQVGGDFGHWILSKKKVGAF